MQDVTEVFDHFRVAARHVWNAGFWSKLELRTWDAYERFEQIKSALFNALVVERLDISPAMGLPVIGNRFRVVPVGHAEVPILINRPREGDRNNYWDDPVSHVDASGAELYFIDYFDWNVLAPIDFQYYRVVIFRFSAHPELAGRQALVEHSYAGIFVENRP
jgi:hypothetical protein